jgi:hypothetical protein
LTYCLEEGHLKYLPEIDALMRIYGARVTVLQDINP